MVSYMKKQNSTLSTKACSRETQCLRRYITTYYTGRREHNGKVCKYKQETGWKVLLHV
jgi:hypothetical protein